MLWLILIAVIVLVFIYNKEGSFPASNLLYLLLVLLIAFLVLRALGVA